MNHKRLDRLREMLAADPTDPFLHYGIAMEHLAAEDWAMALDVFELLHTQFPQYIPTYYHYGKLLFETGRAGDAHALLQEGIKIAQQAGERHALGELRMLLDEVEDHL